MIYPSEDEVHKILKQQWGKGYKVELKEVMHKKSFRCILVLYKVTAERDGFTEYRCKGWGEAMGGWDYVTRRKW